MKDKIFENKKNILLGVLIVGVIAMTVAFAALATNLRINGSANVAATSWNIRFENWQKVDLATGTTGHTNTASYPAAESLLKEDGTNTTKVSNVNVTLNQPGDIAKYTFEIRNRGSIDAKLSNVSVTDTESNSLVGYEVKCYTNYNSETGVFSGDEITTNSVLTKNGGVAYCYLEITYKDQINSHTPGTTQTYTQSAVSTSLTATWTWIQADGTSAATSGGNEQSGGSNNNEPAPVATYYYWDGSAQAISNTLGNWDMYVLNDSGTKQVCGRMGGQTVCLESNRWDYDYEQEPEQEGYITAKKAEVEQITGVSCYLNEEYLDCGDANIGCRAFNDGEVRCDDGYNFCYVHSNGTIECTNE